MSPCAAARGERGQDRKPVLRGGRQSAAHGALAGLAGALHKRNVYRDGRRAKYQEAARGV